MLDIILLTLFSFFLFKVLTKGVNFLEEACHNLLKQQVEDVETIVHEKPKKKIREQIPKKQQISKPKTVEEKQIKKSEPQKIEKQIVIEENHINTNKQQKVERTSEVEVTNSGKLKQKKSENSSMLMNSSNKANQNCEKFNAEASCPAKFFKTFDEIENIEELGQISSIHLNNKDEYEKEIEKLKKLLKKSQRQKQFYILEVQKIMEHIKEHTDVSVENEFSAQRQISNTDVEVIENFKKQINEAHHIEVENFQDQKKNYTEQIQRLKLIIEQKNQERQKFEEKLNVIMIDVEKAGFEQSETLKQQNKKWLETYQKQIKIKLQEQIRREEQVKQTQLQQKIKNLQSQIKQIKSQKQTQQNDQRLKVMISQKEQFQNNLKSMIGELEEQKSQKQNLSKRLEQTQQQLRFCQEQLKNQSQIEKDLRIELQSLKKSPQKQKSISEEDIFSHPEFLKIKKKLEDFESKSQKEKTKTYSSKLQQPTTLNDPKINYAKPSKEREVSPTFKQPYSELQSPPQNEQSSSRISHTIKAPVSSIFVGVLDNPKKSPYGRSITPIEKSPAKSSILSENYVDSGPFYESGFLPQKQKDFLTQQIYLLKKIKVKKTKLIYRSTAVNHRTLYEMVNNIPNILLAVQLKNKKLVCAFTQTAFSNLLPSISTDKSSKYISANKAMLIGLTNQKVIFNKNTHNTISFEKNCLIWGNNEFIVNMDSKQLQVDLNCEGAIYPTKDVSAKEFCGGNKEEIDRIQIYRTYLG